MLFEELTDSSLSPLAAQEFSLANELRRMCDRHGKETNIRESGRVLHKLGLVYRERSPDKISLIRSAVLFNAALVRKPENVPEIKDNLDELYSHVFQLAKVVQTDSNMSKQTELLAAEIASLRQRVDAELLKLETMTDCDFEKRTVQVKRVEIIENLQQYIHDRYSEMMDKVMQYCVSIMGEPPCEYALVGMGSLARKEITPFSDFENIILLEEGVQSQTGYDDMLEYFRWTTVIFQLILINLGETIVPIINLPSLNDPYKEENNWFYDIYTTRGVCFDGMVPFACKFPLGRPETPKKPWPVELIKPVSDMLKYLDTEIDLKNGYHLGDMLTKVCFVSGSITLYKTFYDGVSQCVKQSEPAVPLDKQIQEDIANFSPIVRLDGLTSKHAESCNIKRIVYRSTTLFITALGRYYKLLSQTNFDIVRDLTRLGVIDNNFAQDLLYAVAVACHMRLFTYSRNGRQDDTLNDAGAKDKFGLHLVQIMGVQTSVLYFQTAMKLQRETCNRIGAKQSNFVQYSEELDRLLSSYWLQQYEDTINEADRLNLTLPGAVESLGTVSEVLLMIGHSFFEKSKYTKSLCCYERVRAMWASSVTPTCQADLAYCLYRIGGCLSELEQYDDALKHHKEELEIRKQVTASQDSNSDMARCFASSAQCYFELSKPDQALEFFEQAKAVLKKNGDPDLQAEMVECKWMHARCLFVQDRSDDALEEFREELTDRKRVSEDENKDPAVAWCFFNIGQCHFILAEFEEAAKFYSQAKEVWKNNGDLTYLENILECCKRLGNALHEIERFDEAFDEYKETLTIRGQLAELSCPVENRETEEGDDIVQSIKIANNEVAESYFGLGTSCYNMNRYQEALRFFHQAKILWAQANSQASYSFLGNCLRLIAECLCELNMLEDALQHYEKALWIRQQETSDSDSDIVLAMCHFDLADCLLKLEKYSDALTHYERAKLIWTAYDDQESLADEIAECKQMQARCLFHLGRYDEALAHYEQEITDRKSNCDDVESDPDMAACYFDSAECLLKLHRREEAFRLYSKAKKIWEADNDLTLADQMKLTKCTENVNDLLSANPKFARATQ